MKLIKNRSIAVGIAASLLIGFGVGFGVKGMTNHATSACASEAAPVPVHKIQTADIFNTNRMLGPNLWDVVIDPLFEPPSFVAKPLAVEPLIAFPVDIPKVQTTDGDKELQVIAQVPGMTQKDVDVQVSDTAITIKGHKTNLQKDSALFASTDETFQQTMQLPCKVCADKVQAAVKDGVLTVSLPKANPS